MLIKRPHGFTLIEMMIVVLIVAILTVIGLPSFSEWLQNSRTRSVAESVQNGIRFAQSESARLSRLTNFISTSSGWTVKVVPIAGSSSPIDSRTTPLESSPAGNLDSVVINAEHAVLQFNDLGRVSYASSETDTFTALGSDTSIAVSNSNSSATRKLQINVSPSGKVRMCDPDKSLATDPAGC